MSLKRRQLFKFFGLSAGSLLVGSTATPVSASEKEFLPPTAEHPLILSFNENPLGMSEKAREALSAAGERASRYPFAQVGKLKELLAKYMHGTPDEILPTHGSAEAIRAAVEAYKNGGAALIVPELTYSDGSDVAKRNHMPIIRVKMGPNWSIDVAAMKKAAAKEAIRRPVIVYFVNPNNPTGTIADNKALFDWIKSKPKNTFFILDEAYGEFVNDPSYQSCAQLVRDGYNNLVILKTFSKIFAMAGLRLGFAFGTKDVIDRIRDHVAYDVMMNQATIAAAMSEIEDEDFLTKSKASNDESRSILVDALKELKIPYLPSETNFIFIDLKKPQGEFVQHMKEANIWVGRPFPPATNWCRISLGTPAQMRYFVKVLKEFREKGWV